MAPAPLDGKAINGIFGGVRTLQMRVDHIDRVLTKDLELWKEVCALRAHQSVLMNKLESLVKVVQLLSGKCLGVNECDLYSSGADDDVLKILGLPMVLGRLPTVCESKTSSLNPDATPFTPIRPGKTKSEFSTAEKGVCGHVDWPMQDERMKFPDAVNCLEIGALTHLHELCLESLQLLPVGN